MKKIETYDEFKILTVRRIPRELIKAHVRKSGYNGIVACGEHGGIYVSNLPFSAIKIKRLTYNTQLDIAETLHLMDRVHESVVSDIKLKIDLQEQKSQAMDLLNAIPEYAKFGIHFSEQQIRILKDYAGIKE